MSESDNPYTAPQASLTTGAEQKGGSIENTLAGNAELDIGAVMSEAWDKTKGIKRIVIGGGIIVYVAVAIVVVVIGLIFGMENAGIVRTLLTQLILIVVLYPFMAGVFMVGLRQSVGIPVNFAQQFQYYGVMGPIVAVGLLTAIATSIGYLLLIIPGIYLGIALSLAIPLKVEKDLGIVDCLTTSLKIVNKKFLNVFALAIIAGLVMALSFITIIGWIWAIPWALMVFSICYRQLAGVELTE